MEIKNGVKNIQTAGYNGARTVDYFFVLLFMLKNSGSFLGMPKISLHCYIGSFMIDPPKLLTFRRPLIGVVILKDDKF